MTDAWTHLREFTAARLALGRSGGSLPTASLLDFRLAHARARDAVLSRFDPDQLAATLRPLDPRTSLLDSQAADRAEYLQRPDRGRKLDAASRERVLTLAGNHDLVILVSDGLSTFAAERQAPPTLAALLPLLQTDGWQLAPLLIVRHARVALQDEVGALIGARLSLILLGERPGLGSPDSLGAYFTHTPLPGRTDAERNCVSNIRPEGLAPAAAARKLHALLTSSRELGYSGYRLKDDTGPLLDPPARSVLT